MQLTEIVLFNTPTSVYAKPSENLVRGARVVLNVGGSLEMGVVKNSVDVNDAEIVSVLRTATREDNLKHCENCRFARTLLPEIKKEAEKLNLDMKIGFITTNLDRTKLTVNYTADERVDFRELLKVLGAKYKMRIEMRQIGNRDETKVVGAIGICGRETCCKLYLNDFDKVSIKMAKNQNIALNPNRINGMCGRLLCCLKYEDEFYEKMQKLMPKINSNVTTPDGVGTVVGTDFLKETVTVNFVKDDTSEQKVYNLADIKIEKPKRMK